MDSAQSHFLTAGCLCFFSLSNQIIQYGLRTHHTAETYTPLKRSHSFFSAALELLHSGDLTLQNLKHLNRKGNRFYTGEGCHFGFEIMEPFPLSLHFPCRVKVVKGWRSASSFTWKTQASRYLLKYFSSKSICKVFCKIICLIHLGKDKMTWHFDSFRVYGEVKGF